MFENLKDDVLKTVNAIYKYYLSLLRLRDTFYAMGARESNWRA